MKTQISISLDHDILDALKKLAERERRSVSGMAGLLLVQKIEELRGEYRHDPKLSSLPKTPKTSVRGWDRGAQEQFGG